MTKVKSLEHFHQQYQQKWAAHLIGRENHIIKLPPFPNIKNKRTVWNPLSVSEGDITFSELKKVKKKTK